MIKVCLHFHLSILLTRTPTICKNEAMAIHGFKSAGIPIVDLNEDPTHVVVLMEDGHGAVSKFCEGQHKLGRHTNPSFKSLPYHLNKWKQNELAVSLGVPAPKSVRVNYTTTFEEVADQVGAPFYYKPFSGMGGACVFYISKPDQFHAVPGFIAQQSIGRPGTDIACAVVQDKVVDANLRYSEDPTVCRPPVGTYRITKRIAEEIPKIQEVCAPIAKYIQNGMSVFNLLRDTKGNVYFNEINHVSIYPLYHVNAFELYAKSLLKEHF